MKVNAEKIDNTRAQVTVELATEEFEESLTKAYRIVVKKLNVPGFRKGKAPRRLLENIYGKEILLEDALQDAIPKAYLQALMEVREQYTAVSEPDYEMVQTEIGKPIIFKAAFDIKPEVKLGQYKGLELEKAPVRIKAEDVDREIAVMQQRYAKLVVTDGPAQMGDVLTIDFLGKVNGQPFRGGAAEGYALELGSQSFIEGFEAQLAGTMKDETKDIQVTFPEEYHSQELAGKEATFTVTVKEIKRKEVAALDDEFAKDVSEFATMQELRQDIENKLKEKAEKSADAALRNAAVEKAAQNAELEIPASMIESRIDRMVEDISYRLIQQGLKLENYLEATKTTPEDFRNSYKERAEAATRADLVLEAIIKAEDIQATPEDLENEIAKVAGEIRKEPAEVREMFEKQGQIPALEFSIRLEKAVDSLVKEAQIVEAKEE